MQKAGNRHLVDIRAVQFLPPVDRVDGVLVAAPAELIASKAIAFVSRRSRPKAFTDRRNVAVLLLKFPQLKTDEGDVYERLAAPGAKEETHRAWRELVAEAFLPENDDKGY